MELHRTGQGWFSRGNQDAVINKRGNACQSGRSNQHLLHPARSVRQAGEKWRAGGVWLCYVAYVTFFTDVNVAFQQSAHKVLLDDDNLLPLLHLTIEYHGKEQKGLPFILHLSSPASHHLFSFLCFHLQWNHVILDLRNHQVQCLNFMWEDREVQRGWEAQAMVFVCRALEKVCFSNN